MGDEGSEHVGGRGSEAPSTGSDYLAVMHQGAEPGRDLRRRGRVRPGRWSARAQSDCSTGVSHLLQRVRDALQLLGQRLPEGDAHEGHVVRLGGELAGPQLEEELRLGPAVPPGGLDVVARVMLLRAVRPLAHMVPEVVDDVEHVLPVCVHPRRMARAYELPSVASVEVLAVDLVELGPELVVDGLRDGGGVDEASELPLDDASGGAPLLFGRAAVEPYDPGLGHRPVVPFDGVEARAQVLFEEQDDRGEKLWEGKVRKRKRGRNRTWDSPHRERTACPW